MRVNSSPWVCFGGDRQDIIVSMLVAIQFIFPGHVIVCGFDVWRHNFTIVIWCCIHKLEAALEQILFVPELGYLWCASCAPYVKSAPNVLFLLSDARQHWCSMQCRFSVSYAICPSAQSCQTFVLIHHVQNWPLQVLILFHGPWMCNHTTRGMILASVHVLSTLLATHWNMIRQDFSFSTCMCTVVAVCSIVCQWHMSKFCGLGHGVPSLVIWLGMWHNGITIVVR